MSTKTYKIYAALYEDAKEGWIWISPNPELAAQYVRVRNQQNGKTIVCECRSIDLNFRKYYDSRPNTTKLPDSGDFMVVNAAIRDRLGISKGNVSLEVTNVTCWWDRYVKAFLNHPHPAIRVGIVLGLISVTLGIVGFLLGLISLFK